MTDPRSALADILMDAMYAKGYQNPKLFAAEIIKRLPPDWMLISKPMLLRALVDVEEDKIDPRWFADEMPDDYEPPGLGCEDVNAIWNALSQP